MRSPFVVVGVVALTLLLHQDAWNWTNPALVMSLITGLVFGLLPVGLAYHVGYSVLASLVMAYLVRVAWPKGLDDAPGDMSKTKENAGDSEVSR